MKKEELLELESLDGPRLAEIANEKVKGKPTERANEIKESIELDERNDKEEQ